MRVIRAIIGVPLLSIILVCWLLSKISVSIVSMMNGLIGIMAVVFLILFIVFHEWTNVAAIIGFLTMGAIVVFIGVLLQELLLMISKNLLNWI